jgi:hypothetical protein
MTRTWLLLALLAGALAAPMLQDSVMADDDPNAVLARYANVQRDHRATLLAVPGVTGTGVGMSEKNPGLLVIRVYVKPGDAEVASSQLPIELDGVPVEIVERKPMRPQ